MNDIDYCQTVLDLTQALDHFIGLAKDETDEEIVDTTIAGMACILLEELSEKTLDCILDNFKKLKIDCARNMKEWEEEMLKYNIESTPDPRDDFKSNLLNIKGGVENGHSNKENKVD